MHQRRMAMRIEIYTCPIREASDHRILISSGLGHCIMLCPFKPVGGNGPSEQPVVSGMTMSSVESSRYECQCRSGLKVERLVPGSWPPSPSESHALTELLTRDSFESFVDLVGPEEADSPQ
jgi:hypothetical protein